MRGLVAVIRRAYLRSRLSSQGPSPRRTTRITDPPTACCSSSIWLAVLVSGLALPWMKNGSGYSWLTQSSPSWWPWLLDQGEVGDEVVVVAEGLAAADAVAVGGDHVVGEALGQGDVVEERAGLAGPARGERRRPAAAGPGRDPAGLLGRCRTADGQAADQGAGRGQSLDEHTPADAGRLHVLVLAARRSFPRTRSSPGPAGLARRDCTRAVRARADHAVNRSRHRAGRQTGWSAQIHLEAEGRSRSGERCRRRAVRPRWRCRERTGEGDGQIT